METLDMIKPAVCSSKNEKNELYEEDTFEEDTFEADWERSISGEELVKRVHEHIDRFYANKKQ
jgi:hypothetical protein